MMHRYMLACLAALGLVVAAASAAQDSDAMDRIPRPDAEPTRRCLPISHIARIETVDDQTLLFHMRGRDKYVNHLPRRCPGLKRNSFVHESSLNSYCDMDIISVVDLRVGMRLGSCPLGHFEKVSGPLELE